MDIVDTLRYDEALMTRELDEPRREAALIERLREIYRSQGLAVPDRVLEEGAGVLKESRFVYTPPKPGWARTVAQLWVNRGRIGKTALALLAAVGLAWAVYAFGIAGPEHRRAEQQRLELADRLPRALDQAHAEPLPRRALSLPAREPTRSPMTAGRRSGAATPPRRGKRLANWRPCAAISDASTRCVSCHGPTSRVACGAFPAAIPSLETTT
jgi:hypothetical protein